MTIEKAKHIPLVEFLQSQGFAPVKHTIKYTMFKSPFREERTGSFAVYENNTWYDFGSGDHGDIIELVKMMYGLSTSEALKRLAFSYPSFDDLTPVPKRATSVAKQETPFDIISISSIETKYLIAYAKGRGIWPSILKAECQEAKYKLNGKCYTALCFINNSGGYEFRSKTIKISSAPKDISLRKRGESNKECCVFEGFFDYLSYLSMMLPSQRNERDCIILNSTAMINKAIDILKNYDTIHCYLDNDESGRKATNVIVEMCESIVIDHALAYDGFTDLNEMLCVQEKQRKMLWEI